MKAVNISWPNKYHSASAISVGIFYKNYNKYHISKYGCGSFDEYIRGAYYGGRCEVFGNPDQDEIIHHFDYSGMYGQCMLEKFPYGEMTYLEYPDNFSHVGFYRIS
jgi:hypothetical protein